MECLQPSGLSLSPGWLNSLLLGQLLSILLTGTGTFAQLLAARESRFQPAAMNLLNYFLLSLHVFLLPCRAKGLSTPWLKFFLVALADVEGNFFLVLAYRYTTITSVQILDSFTIPCVMALSLLCFRKSYSRWQYLGAFFCLLGLMALVATDFYTGRNDEGGMKSNKAVGDVLVICGCFLYSLSNLGQEHLVKNVDRVEFLAMLGFFGCVVTFVHIAAFERDAFAELTSHSSSAWLELGGYVACLFGLYMLTPTLLIWSNAVFLNLSFLTADFWSIVVAIFVFHSTLYFSYFVALGLTVCGLLLWNLSSSPPKYPLLINSEYSSNLDAYSSADNPLPDENYQEHLSLDENYQD
eukprot:g66945.t1